MRQLALTLPERRTPARQKTATERLLEILKRSGVNTGRDDYKGRVMFRPMLARPVGLYADLCNGWACQNRPMGTFISGYGNKAEASRAADQQAANDRARRQQHRKAAA